SWTDSSWSALRNLPVPSLPRANLPRVNLPWPSMPSVSVPRISSPGTPGRESGMWLLWLGLGVIFLVVLWKLSSRYVPGLARGKEPNWNLGPWRVDPATVATRRELVLAFEYLSLLKLGRPAESWNHRDIAAGLAPEDSAPPEQRRAAELLATVYEKARYT